MSAANILLMDKISDMKKQETAYIGEAELPAYYFSFGGSVPSDHGYGLLLDKPCILKKIVYYNLGTDDDFLMVIKIVNYDTKEELKSFSVNRERLVLDLNIPTQGMIGVEIMSSNEPEGRLSRHRIILYAQ